VGTAALGGVGAACAVGSIEGTGWKAVSALDFIGSEADRAAIAAGTYDDDLTGVLHGALDQIQAAGGGVLFFPRGLYPCNLVLGGTTGRTRVHLKGEVYGATRLRSFAAGGWAVQDIIEDDQGWAPLDVLRRSISSFTFLGDGRARCGLLIASKHGTETTDLVFYECLIGLMVCDAYYGTHLRPQFRSCDVGAWFGQVSGRLTTPDVTLPPFLASAPGHAGNQKMLGSQFALNRVGLLALGDDGTPMLQLDGGAFEGNELGIFVPDAATRDTARQIRRIWGGLYIENIWFEANGDGTPGTAQEIVNGWNGTRGDIHLGKGVIHADGLFAEQITVTAGGMLYGDNAIYNRSGGAWVFMNAPFGRVIYDRADGDAGNLGFIGPIVRRPMPSTAKWATTAFLLPKGAFGRHLRARIADRCDGDGFGPGISSSTPDRWTFQVADGPIATTCWQMDAPAGTFTTLVLSHDYAASKAYVLIAAVKAISAAVTLQAFGQEALHGNKWLPPGQWYFIAMTSVADLNTNADPINFGINNEAREPRRVRFGGIALLKFDGKEEAAEVGAQALFPII
jgi:hypothetical protein